MSSREAAELLGPLAVGQFATLAWIETDALQCVALLQRGVGSAAGGVWPMRSGGSKGSR